MTSPKFMRTLIEWVDKHSNPIALLETQQVLSLRRTLIVFGLLVLALWMGSCAVIEETSSGEEMSLTVVSNIFHRRCPWFQHSCCSTVPIDGVKTSWKCYI